MLFRSVSQSRYEGSSEQTMRIVSEDIDRIENGLTEALNVGNHTMKPKVKYSLTGNVARLEIRLDGAPEMTNERMQRVYEAITTYFNAMTAE